MTFLWRWSIRRHTSRMRAHLTLQLSFVMCKLPCGCLWGSTVMGSLPCGGICPVELVCDLVSSHLAACNLHDPRTEYGFICTWYWQPFVFCFVLFLFVFFFFRNVSMFSTQWLAKVTDIMAWALSESTVKCFVKAQFLHFDEFRERRW